MSGRRIVRYQASQHKRCDRDEQEHERRNHRGVLQLIATPTLLIIGAILAVLGFDIQRTGGEEDRTRYEAWAILAIGVLLVLGTLGILNF